MGLVIACAVTFITLLAVQRYRSGGWKMPGGDDLVWVKKKITGEPTDVPRVIYLHRGALTLTGGDDAAHRNRSSVVASAQRSRVTVPGFNGSNARWQAIVKCVRTLFSPFDIEVVEERPSGSDYMMVVVGGRARDIGIESRHVGGLAPFNGDVIPGAVVFAFSRSLGNRTRAVCETVGMEVAHAYGLDHGYLCKDVMTYKHGCGGKRFVDKSVRCGESKPRDCKGGGPEQNSYRHLLGLVGPREWGACKLPGGAQGRCRDRYQCRGKSYSKRCPGPKDIRCCID